MSGILGCSNFKLMLLPLIRCLDLLAHVLSLMFEIASPPYQKSSGSANSDTPEQYCKQADTLGPA